MATHRLGNAVCPPLMAAIAGAVLARCPGVPPPPSGEGWVAEGRAVGVRLAIEAVAPGHRRAAALLRLRRGSAGLLERPSVACCEGGAAASSPRTARALAASSPPRELGVAGVVAVRGGSGGGGGSGVSSTLVLADCAPS